ncbi:MAG: 2-succinyl-5-enolpyruvyl-6-hydroxy-3-cyclohexene-1-carboxylic-acid synthase [Planctomycetota bacterium]|jgi:2-succinyl-5-enolpyruvyl-6-hydroxy-3-cyclohexene-1-carboxylate synthase|nr:2-succinyl-5-enolpyruvyl-6-hydroxy-3-cyclohexene-1-carboxylic-acid synthase [Planctomycetota bacterium]
MDPNRNALWCRCIVEELHRAGVRRAVLCPGKRNLPLAFAFAAHPEIEIISHIDERSAAFMALGLARVSKRPVAICTTSGSAVANCVPALCEAQAAHLPLLVCGADRPASMHGCEAPQTMPQAGAFNAFIDSECALELPADDRDSLIELRQQVHAWAARCARQGGGPGFLNVPLDEPLSLAADPHFHPPGDDGRLPAPARPGNTTGKQTALEAIALHDLRPGMRGVIVAGPRCPLSPEQVAKLAAGTGFPVIADAASNCRHDNTPNLICTADAILTGPLRNERAELIIRLGPAPLARPVFEWLQAHRSARVLRIDDARIARDFCHAHFVIVVRPSQLELKHVAEQLAPGDANWLARWADADATARAGHAEFLNAAPWGEVSAAAAVCRAAANFTLLQTANSMAVRHSNLHCLGNFPQQVIAHRGVNGIDGTLGSFLGALHGSNGPGLLLTGDLAFLHDLPALTAIDRSHMRGAICVIDNGGGAIFDLLHLGEHPNYQQLVRTPRPVRCDHFAAAFDCHHRRCDTHAELQAALTEAQSWDGLGLIHIPVPPESLKRELPALTAAMLG